ncbi:MAG: tripartite tricarboxylate transporter substrate binding protein [Burkholderiales bacterium]|nr:tripartite tricarboxylate transporter substrate binding protein [Burkholderiales bacterium]
MLTRRAIRPTGVFLAIALATAASAQEPAYPKRGNVDLTVLFPAGTSADITARLLAQGMSKFMNANVVVVNRPGAGGAVGYRYAAAQKPDGYAIVWNSNSISTTHHSGQLAFDYKAFDPVARALVESPLLVVRSEPRWKSLSDFVIDAKARPGVVTVANSGTGSHTHISAAALARAAGITIVDVPYGAAQVVPNVLGGHVDAMVMLPAAVAAHLQGGKLRAIASLTPARDPTLPDVPTARELGIDVALEAWRGIAVPKGVPAPQVAMMEAAIRRTVESTEFTQGTEKLYVRPAFLGTQAFGELIAKEDVELARIMQAIGLKK